MTGACCTFQADLSHDGQRLSHDGFSGIEVQQGKAKPATALQRIREESLPVVLPLGEWRGASLTVAPAFLK